MARVDHLEQRHDSRLGWFTVDALPEPPHSQLPPTLELFATGRADQRARTDRTA
ncbi:hypothetical protein ACIBF5_24175 [Micromonospora sp. NPDC050417]|uniref:hypothetical protein n=1 Tax=Micromonospora sp. NPDC050417 TaxID=3364280 RepID=UPI0037A7AB02